MLNAITSHQPHPELEQRGEIADNESSSISNWLTNSWNYIRSWFSDPTIKPNRYFRLGWNGGRQYCYTDDEIKLINQLSQKYEENFGISEKNPFQLSVEKKFYDWWTCSQPTMELTHHYTLPNREAKDGTIFPLWYYADDLAKQIANWQAERVKHQNLDLMNDPIMLVLEHLRQLFFSELTETGCNVEEINKLTKLESYLKQIRHLIPSLDHDRTNLLKLPNRLATASKMIQTCVANKKLPEFLSDIIIKTRSLENTLGSYLHFLLIDEEVAENFSNDFTENPTEHYRVSPISKAYHNVFDKKDSSSNAALASLQAVNRFYELQTFDTNKGTKVILQPKESVLDGIQFAKFVETDDKNNFKQALAALESLITTRKTLEEFNDIQSTIGALFFASSYQKTTQELADNFQALVDKIYTVTESLIIRADEILEKNLQSAHSSRERSSFEKNLEALDNQFAKSSTTLKQLENYCSRAKKSMEAYQAETKRLALKLQSGEAKQEVGEAMQKLLTQINHINQLLSAQLTKNELLLEDSEIAALTTEAAQLCVDTEGQVECQKYLHGPDKQAQRTSEIRIAKTPAKPFIESNSDSQQTSLDPANNLQDDANDNQPANSRGASILYSGLQGAAHGSIRGLSNVINDFLQTKHWSPQLASYLSQMSYYSLLFSYYFTSQQANEHDETPWVTAAINAAYLTGQTWLLNGIISGISYCFNKMDDLLMQRQHPAIAKTIRNIGSLTKFGIFAYDAQQRGFAESSAALIAGTTSQLAVESLGKKLTR